MNHSTPSTPEDVSVSAGIIVYRKTEEGIRYLLLYHGGPYWNFPKGKLVEGERSFRAALREVNEETGLHAGDLRVHEQFRVSDRFAFFTPDRKRIKREVIYYLAETRQQQIRISDEHQGFGWFAYRDALRLLIAPNLKRNLKRANALILRKASVPGSRNPMPRSGRRSP